MIEVLPVHTKKELKEFVMFPFKLYKNHPYWVPPMITEEMETLDQKRNPVFQNASAQYFLAYKNGSIVGRIAVIINHIEVKQQTFPCVLYYWQAHCGGRAVGMLQSLHNIHIR